MLDTYRVPTGHGSYMFGLLGGASGFASFQPREQVFPPIPSLDLLFQALASNIGFAKDSGDRV
jgi:hypothetical protein